MKWFDVESGTDFNCPKCDKGLDAMEWNTEYGDPLHGNFEVDCPFCKAKFYVRACPTVEWTVQGDKL